MEMRWLPNISFSSSSSSSSASFSVSLKSGGVCESVDLKKSGSSEDMRYSLFHRGNHRLGGGGPALVRARKLRYLSDYDIASSSSLPLKSHDDSNSAEIFRSRSSYDHISASRAPSVAVPLPLPIPDVKLDEERSCLKKEKELDGVRHRDRKVVAVEGVLSLSPVASLFAGLDKKVVDSSTENSQESFGLSAPFGSPISIHQRRSDADLFLYHNMVPKGKQVWSAPEMLNVETSGLPPPALFDYTAISDNSSPIQSPSNKSPIRNHKSSSRSSSPFKANSSHDTSAPCLEASSEVHPLPLPPGPALPCPATQISRVMPKSESSSMISQWQKGKLIGRGTFGSVYVASNKETGALCAMKEVELFPDDPKSAESMKQLEQEIKVLSQLKHPNIVQYYGSEIVHDKFYIYLEYVHPGSINKYVREHCGAMTESVVRNFTRHILSGLAYLHSRKTIHRDIKGANLLVDASGVVKLADFGMAKHLTGAAYVLSMKGSPYWMAPELMQTLMQKDTSSDLAFAVDIWSLGCTIIEMLTGKPPWSEFEGAAAMFKVLKDSPALPEDLSPDGRDFLRCCFTRNPAERPTASMLLEHRFVNRIWMSPCR